MLMWEFTVYIHHNETSPTLDMQQYRKDSTIVCMYLWKLG